MTRQDALLPSDQDEDEVEARPSPSKLSDERKLALLQAVFDETPEVMLLKGAYGSFLLCKRNVARLYDATPEAMVGKHDDDCRVPKEMADGFRYDAKGV